MLRRYCIHLLLCATFATDSIAIPSLSHGGLDGFSLLPYGGSVSNGASNHLEIRGVIGGRKKRYVIEREKKKKCCRNKFCKSLGEILDKDCKCTKCPAGKFPDPGGKNCQEGCPTGTEKTPDGKGCCPAGQKQSPTGDKCELDCGTDKPGPDGKCPEKKKDDDDRARRKGKCPDGFMLDPKEGIQDMNAANPVCAPDDFDKCPPGELPETRTEADDDPKRKQDCAKPDPNNRKKCNPKKYYVDVWVRDIDGKTIAEEKCQLTRQYKQRKKNRVERMKFWKQKKWENEKSDRDHKKQQEEDERKRKEEELKKNIEETDKKNKEKNDGKRRRLGRCLPVVALIEGVGFVAAKRSLNLAIRKEEHPYEWTTEYFDEDFVQSDDILKYWPADVTDFDPNVDINTDAFTSQWSELIQHEMLKSDMQTCTSGRKRCKRTDDTSPLINPAESLFNASLTANPPPKELDERFVQIIPLLIDIAAFASRMATLLRNVSASIARVAPRLGEIVKDTNRLFQLAKPGQGARGGLEGMKNAAGRISQNRNWKECLKGGKPL